ncbi:MAG: MauE/DoxX family redox-associated membrane protein [Propionibacteriaceae bacterium]
MTYPATTHAATTHAATIWVSTLVRLGLAGVLLVAGSLKVIDPHASVQAVAAYELLSPALETWVGWGLPFLEIALGLLLAAGLMTRWAAAAAGLLMVVFIVGVVSAWTQGLSIDCGCFGGGGQVAPGEERYLGEILRDLGFLAMAVWLVVRPRSRFSLDHLHDEETDEQANEPAERVRA